VGHLNGYADLSFNIDTAPHHLWGAASLELRVR